MATDLSQFTVPNNRFDVAQDNAAKLDSVVNGPNAVVTTRTGKGIQSIDRIIESIAAVTDRGAWTTATSYQVKDLVTDTGIFYIAVTAHTSGATFAGDVANWRVYQSIPQVQGDERYGVIFVTSAAMQASSPTVGQRLSTDEFSTGNGGGGDYIVEAGDTSNTFDRLLLANGNTAVLVIVQGEVYTKKFGAKHDGVSDDTLAIQAAINRAELGLPNSSVDVVAGFTQVIGGGGVVGLTAELVISKKISFRFFNGLALSAYSASTFMLSIASTAEKCNIANINLDGGLVGGTRFADLIENNAERISMRDVFGVHFPNYGLRVVSGQESTFDNVIMREWQFTEAGTTDGTLRTAKGISAEDADMMFVNCVAAQCLYPLYVNNALNQFTTCHFYNGASLNTTEDVSVFLDNCDNNQFSGSYFDNGLIKITDSFNHKFSGCHYQTTAAATNTAYFETITSAVGETIDGLNVVGGTANGLTTNVRKSVTGPGTYVALEDQRYTWIGVVDDTGAVNQEALKISDQLTYDVPNSTMTVTSSGDALTFRAKKSLRLSADYDANSGASQSEVLLATDGVDRYMVGVAGEMEPVADNAQVFGSPTKRMNNMFSNRMTLIDGVTAPGTVTGHASLYVDTADGDLKIKFGDGTVKTIVTDT
jgi:hypothetical protein